MSFISNCSSPFLGQNKQRKKYRRFPTQEMPYIILNQFPNKVNYPHKIPVCKKANEYKQIIINFSTSICREENKE